MGAPKDKIVVGMATYGEPIIMYSIFISLIF